jgi:hypothetical protein
MSYALWPRKVEAPPSSQVRVPVSGLRIGKMNDSLEQEADRVANQIVANGTAKRQWSLSTMGIGAPLQRKCACGSAGEECEDCKQEKMVQRKAASSAGPGLAPPIVNEVLNSAGQPLDRVTREFLEPRFGHDFSKVRVHTGSQASESARSVQALAYTFGHDVVFAERQYQPQSMRGIALLAHELAHVIQQGQGSGQIQRFVPAEAEAEAEEEEDEREDDARKGDVEAPSGRRSTPFSPNSFHGRLEAYRRGETAEQVKFEMEQPASTTERGGTASNDFKEEKPEATETAATSLGEVQVRYTPTVFHMLDAMEADIARARSSEDILDIYLSYFRDSAAALASQAITSRRQFRTFADETTMFRITPAGADRDGTARTMVFVTAVKRRTDLDPKLSTDPTLESIIRGLVEFDARQEQIATDRAAKTSGPCLARPIPRKGGNKTGHDDYAREVTGQVSDYEVSAPNGPKCAFDGLDATDPKVVWEVKTRHEWSTPQGIAGGIFNPHIQDAILTMESQMERCSAVAKRCGYEYKWAFENESAAKFMQVLWAGRVKVVHIPRGSEPT